MKRHFILKTIITSVILMLFAYAIIYGQVISKISSAFVSHKEKIPSFSFTTLNNSKKINTSDIKTDGTFLILYISPDCPICKEQLHEIVTNHSQVSNIQMYILSPFPLNQVKDYFTGYNIDQFKNITAGIDIASHFAWYYKIHSVPCLAFYDKYRNLKKFRIGILDCTRIRKICDSINRETNKVVQ